MTRSIESQADSGSPAAAGRVLTISLRRIRRGRAVAFAPTEPEPAPPPKPRPSRAAQILALAHEFQRLIDTGEVPDRAALASQVGLTRARVTQIMDLLLLAPDIQEAMLVEGSAHETERRLRATLRTLVWDEQRQSLEGGALTAGPHTSRC